MTESSLTMDYEKRVELTPLEAKTLKQYQTLALSLALLKNEIQNVISDLEGPESRQQQDGVMTADLAIEKLRSLEEKFGLISTSFKNSVYRVFVNGQQQQQQALSIEEEQAQAASQAIHAAQAIAASFQNGDVDRDVDMDDLTSTINGAV
ncbi:unnamed protein product [Ambrosiozyma monospora]|uniref:Unnamed protein product n=1 Tax=Ambrosiozyma monospora TaxID=43982 RepID=A0ACB5TDN9_AMBMO|nr:unnamed protein product [Ambrosiozyma monospora]